MLTLHGGTMSKFNTLALRTLGDDYRENWLWYTRKYKTTISKNDLKVSDLIHLRKKKLWNEISILHSSPQKLSQT